ncbi:MAG: rhodanese-like domain-containing protein [Nitrosopumilus sp.]|nr:rhodanese-like domain-containing protein [Nitrosopumilus sp.]MDH3488497.1 rhodanese-like domain-containing protein [Nitrosopumilus sp.]
MNRLIWIAGIILVAIVGVLTFATQDASTNPLAVSTSDLVLMQSEGAMIIDIRNAESYIAGHIPGFCCRLS